MESQVNRIPSCGAASEVACNTNLVYQSAYGANLQSVSLVRKHPVSPVAASRLGKFLSRDPGLADRPGLSSDRCSAARNTDVFSTLLRFVSPVRRSEERRVGRECIH